MAIKWLNRSIITSPLHFALCLKAKDFQRELKRLNVPRDDWPNFILNEYSHATTHFLQRRGKIIAIVCLGSTKGRTPVEINGLLVHEAVHIWQEIRENIGEARPSSEFEAYSIQAIAQSLMDAYRERRR